MNQIKKELQKLANPQKAKILQKFFKTGKGEYGEGDVFLGIPMSDLRQIAKQYQETDLKELEQILCSAIHEYRMVALLIASSQYKKETKKQKKKEIYKFFIKHSKQINNWDLVDVNVPGVVGDYLLDNDRAILYKFAQSKNLWQRRIAVLACYAFIRENDFKDILKISKILLNDEHDLIHKAVGWMLREVGKRDQAVLENFLQKHYQKMPRMMLRYSIEKFEEGKRKKYLKNKI